MKLLCCAVLFGAALGAQTFSGGPALDDAINLAISEHRLPGAVLIVGHHDKIVYRKAYGSRALYPASEPMTVDTIFDIASLTKVIATTSSVMKLFEQGRFRLNDKVTDYIPEFMGGKSDITVRNLLTHFSGLQPDVPLKVPWSGYRHGIELACTFAPGGPPNTSYVYSDINFILLGEIVHRLTGKLVSDYARENIFNPLGMKDSQFQPPAALRPRIAPTERDSKTQPPYRGVVHDPTARYMGGVAGHAGLFSTADDLARFAQMMLNGGELDGRRIFNPLTITKFTEPQTPPDQPILRGLGWDLDSPHSSNRGELFPIGSFGHTGFTGTSIWIDPMTRTYVILLANSVHIDGRPSMVPLRARVATIAAAGTGATVQTIALTGYNETMTGAGARRTVARNGNTRTGLDVLEDRKFQPFKGKRVGLITNHTGIDRQGRRNLDVMRQAGVQVVALFSPEHGIAGTEDREDIRDSVDAAKGIRVFSLYGETRRPTAQSLQGIDALVFDIQDVGARFYTYVSTMAYAMEEAAKARVPFYVLDRPNPITGVHVEAPLMDPGNTSFVGLFPGVPLRHGMTIGELAQMLNAENKIGAALTVIQMQDWNRGDWLDSTNLPWINPSPNMRSLKAATLYPAIGMLEYSTNYSVGRGTDSPFEQVGAAFIVGRDLASYLNKRLIPGVRVYPTSFTPTDSNLKGQRIEGVRFELTNRDLFDASRLGIELAVALQKLYPGKIDFAVSKRLIGSDDLVRRIQAGEDPRGIATVLGDGLQPFLALRQKYLLYR